MCENCDKAWITFQKQVEPYWKDRVEKIAPICERFRKTTDECGDKGILCEHCGQMTLKLWTHCHSCGMALKNCKERK